MTHTKPENHNHSARVQDEQCTCSWFNAHLRDLSDWRPDPACPRHGLNAPYRLDIDTSYTKEEQ